MITLTDPRPGDPRTATLRRLTWLLDDCIRLPLGFRVGFDALIGLIPGFGDVAGGVAALYGIAVAWQLGTPPVVLARMTVNVTLDTLLGIIPIVGDLWDIGFASNRRNLAILEHWLAKPEHATRRSAFVLILFAATLLLILIGGIVLSIWMILGIARLFWHP
ncbi:MAG TPA: DUF4112 domain-containing protein [Gemmatimonadales bacterium]|nr:DUF4112 domain-containing protein [Gemmatimonadales bacterium]